MNMLQAKKVCEAFEIEESYYISHDNIILNINNEPKAIRKADYSKDRLYFINELKQYIYNNGFQNIDNFCKYKDKFFIEINQDIYYLCNWFNEQEIRNNEENKEKKALQNMARLHIAGNGFMQSENINPKNEIGKLPNLLKKRTEELIKLKKIAEKEKNKFDYLYCQECDFYIKIALDALNEIDSEEYIRVSENAFINNEICHRDYSLYNIAFSKEKLFTYNFDYACFEINAYDIASFLRKILSENKWCIDLFEILLNSYNEIKEINHDEKKIIKALLKFPQKFWRVANRYYNSRRTCPDNGYYIKLKEIYEQKDVYKDFVNNV